MCDSTGISLTTLRILRRVLQGQYEQTSEYYGDQDEREALRIRRNFLDELIESCES